MTNWIVIEIDEKGSKRALSGVYADYAEAAEVQVTMEELHEDKAYLIYSIEM